ncbi:hypothetical protein GX50_08398 [[Emmonsia] crescens]|uniref:Copper-fist domain-containing protein n=1 Tax=[Emmonsia] crescens TaxID=73230 RepID=A0A2B7Z6S7_9EURO|nr:hypothetical protein GX50_08398 [Emmonsia crescens]
MPLDEEGAKWSCEPCVRGHRSSKCQHFDRLMMKVPKAGRPLAKCPHPKGTCSCQKLYAFMVRIPKGSTCLCRPLYQVPMVVTEAGPSAQPTPGLPAPITPTIASRNRIQKRPRRQSSLQAAPELVAKSLSAMDLPSKGYTAPMDHGPNPNASNIQSPYDEQYFQPIPPPTEYPQNQTPNGGFNIQGVYPVQPHSQPQKGGTEPQSATNAGCCAAQPPKEPSTKLPQSCCSSESPKAPEYNSTAPRFKLEEATPSERLMSENSSHLASNYHPTWEHRLFSTTDAEKHAHAQNHTLPHFPHKNSISNLRSNETSSAPATAYSSPNTMRPFRSVTHPMGHFPPSEMHDFGFQSNHIPNDSHPHNCDCGDKCQCLGCASHPFNNTTRQHVQQMGYLITSRGDDQNSESNDNTSRPSFDSQPASVGFDYNNGWPPNNNLPLHSPGHVHWNGPHPGPALDNPGSSATAPAVYDPNQGQMLMQPAAYYELEYPVGLLDPCTNMTGTCQCGVNCSCVGCLTHNGHDGIPLELSPTQDNQTGGPTITGTTGPMSPAAYAPGHTNQPPIENSYTNHDFTRHPQSPVPITPLPV